MVLNRRAFFKWCGSLGLTTFLYSYIKNADSQVNAVNLPALQRYIDLLLPENKMPGALALGADQYILNKYAQDEAYAKAINLGTLWLNYTARKLNKTDFIALPEEMQLKVISISEQSAIATLPYLFYQTIRQDVFQYYYGHPEVLKHFYYARPPQPRGYMDFSEPPHADL